MLNKSYEWFSTFPNISYLAKYYTNNLLAPVVFSEAVRFIPNDAVTIEIAPHDILQYVLNNSLKATVTNIALYKFSHKPNVEIFLHGIGKLYNAELQPQIAKLYPEVKFPVSRSTPMISHLIRWDHSEDWYIYHYVGQKKLNMEEVIVNINLLDKEFIYMTGHVVNRKNLLPATGYLFLIWQMIGWLKKQNHVDIPIVFEDVNFLRSTVLSKQNPVDLTLMIQRGSSKFEIIEGDSCVVTGIVRIPVNIEDEKICSAFIDSNNNDKEEMNTKDIYKELKLRGYQYTGEFRGLRSASITGKNGHIAWTDNWVTFMDNMLQMMILGQNSRTLFIPTRIRKAVIDPKSHIKYIEKLSNEKKQVLVQSYKHLDVLISGEIEIHGLTATALSRRQNVTNPIFEEYKFVAHRDLNVISLQDAIRMSVHVALECYNMMNVKIIEFVENSDQVMPENLNSLHVYKILDDLPKICYNIKIVTINERFKDISLPDNISTMEFEKLSENENCLMILGFGILTKNRSDLYEQLLPAIMPKGFLLTLEELDAIYDYSCLDKYGLRVILEKRTNDKTIILLRKIHDFKTNQQIVHVNNYEFSWVNKIKSFMNVENDNTNTRIIIVAEGDFECGLLGLINCLLKEPGGEMIRSVFIQDGYAPAFSLQESLYMRQLQLDLPVNVLRSGIWGSYRYLPLSLLEPKLVESAYATQMHNIFLYDFLNYIIFRGMTNICMFDKYLTWIIPDKWTMEDAATIPCVYSTCYYALYLNGKMKKDNKVLIHSGAGGVGQADIYLALYEGCEVFTTVGNIKKRHFIRKTFPSIPEDRIGNSRDTSFEQMIIQETRGRGVDIVLNFLTEEKLQASVRCLAKGGRFLEIGKFDIDSNNSLEIFTFSKGISFHGIFLDKFVSAKSENRAIIRNKLTEGLKNGAIKPLCREVFGKNEIETAFRYMAAGKHIGKIMIKIQNENELDAPILAHPRFYCLEHKCYILIGGLGCFCLELTDWLILRGARILVLTSRTGIKNGYQRSRIKLWQSNGVNVQIVTAADPSKYEDCKSVLQFAEKQGPVDAIFNLAIVLKENIFKSQSPQAFEDSFISKAWTTKRMDELSRTICPQLRHFVVFSSGSCGRKKEEWGTIGDVGFVADMQEDDEELVIGGTLQQGISSCLDTLEVFLLQDRPIVSSIVIAEKKKDSNKATNPFEAVVNIMGLKNPNMAAPNMSLPELGMDSMMLVEIKQTLEREFDILLTAKDIRNLTFAKLEKLTNTSEQEKMYGKDDTDTDANDLDGLKMLTRKLNNSDLSPDIYVKLATERKVAESEIFLIPGIDGCASVYKLIGSKIKSSAICLQHGILNMPGVTRSVMKSAAYLLPVRNYTVICLKLLFKLLCT
ncbi:Fatty acid synthase [Camponotus floridanus]|uniref:Fatty acid synthase n=1 Tax=Camponotus floridanus TaxID=104421 RepID=E1ZVG7_CAMFO|nr:Fatty acid synthase [Camponotus floridanus]